MLVRHASHGEGKFLRWFKSFRKDSVAKRAYMRLLSLGRSFEQRVNALVNFEVLGFHESNWMP